MVLLNNYQTPVKATLKFLSFLKVKVNTGMVNKILQNHPDWLSLQFPVLKNEYKTKIILYQIVLIFIVSNVWSQSNFNTHLKVSLSDLNKEFDSLTIEVKLFDSFLGSHYQLYKTFSVPASDIGIDITLPEISSGIMEIKSKESLISGSGSIIFNGDTLIGKFGIFKELIVRG